MIIGEQRLPALLDTHLAPGEPVRLSFTTQARIEHEGRLALLRNKGALERQGRTVYSPIGGGVAIPAERKREFEREFGVKARDWDRKIVDGTIDLRVMLDRSMLPGALTWLLALPPETRSPYRELQEELVGEEGICTEEEIASAALTQLGYRAELKHWRLPHKTNTTFHVYEVWDVQLPEPTLDVLRFGGDERIVWADADTIRRGVASQTIGSNTLALLEWTKPLIVPETVSEFTGV